MVADRPMLFQKLVVGAHHRLQTWKQTKIMTHGAADWTSVAAMLVQWWPITTQALTTRKWRLCSTLQLRHGPHPHHKIVISMWCKYEKIFLHAMTTWSQEIWVSGSCCVHGRNHGMKRGSKGPAQLTGPTGDQPISILAWMWLTLLLTTSAHNETNCKGDAPANGLLMNWRRPS